jgi:hypothetical protein
MQIDIEATRRKFTALGIDFSNFDSMSDVRKLVFIENLVLTRRLTPVYRYSFSRTAMAQRTSLSRGLSGRSEESTSARIEREMSVYEMRSRYRFDFQNGCIFDRFNDSRVDQLHFFRQHQHQNTRYRQVSISIRGLSGKLSAHRMIWAAYHNRWPHVGYVVDHINGNTADNRICNLAEVTQAENVRRAR